MIDRVSAALKSLFVTLSTSPLAYRLAVVGSFACLLLIFVHPFSFRAMPHTQEGLRHLYRLVALDQMVGYGQVWPRYIPGLIFGYGSPIFNYSAPLSLYPAELLHLMGLSILDAHLLSQIIFSFLAALGVFRLARAWMQIGKGTIWEAQVGGLVSGVAYAYAPYTLYNSLRRASLAEVAALALLPWMMEAFWRLALHKRRRDFFVTVLLFALFIPIHNATTLYSTIFLIVYCLFLWWINDHPPQTLIRLLLAGLIAVGLTASFWLPALGEMRYVQFGTTDYHNNFLTFREIFALPLTADLGQMHPPVPRALAWTQILVTLIGGGVLILWGGFTRRYRQWLGLLGGIFLILFFLMIPASAWLWDIFPPLSYIGLPYQLLGLASLLLAMLTGAGVIAIAYLIADRWWRLVWVGGVIATMLLYAMGLLYVQYIPEPRAENIVDVQNFERETGFVATGGGRDYLPNWTATLPPPDRLTGLYAQTDHIPRLQPISGVTVTSASWGINEAELKLYIEEPTTLIFDWLYFPGWWAMLDGEIVQINPSPPEGFISVDIPAGDHTLSMGFGLTWIRLIGMITSGVFILPMIILPFIRPLWKNTNNPEAITLFDGGNWQVLILVACIGVLLFGAKTLIFDRIDTPIRRSRFSEGVEAGVGYIDGSSFEDQINLIGFDLPRDTVRSGGAYTLRLYWQMGLFPAAEDYSSIIYLRDGEGKVIAQTESEHPGDLPTTQWLPGLYMQESLTLDIPAGTPPGTYTIDVALYSEERGRTLDVFDQDSNLLGVTREIASVMVSRPALPARFRNLGVDDRRSDQLTESVTLLGVEGLSTGGPVGQPMLLSTYWKANKPTEQDISFTLLWDCGVSSGRTQRVRLAPNYPTNLWKRGDIWRGYHRLYIPGSLESGRCEIMLELWDGAGNLISEPLLIGEARVTAPERNFDLPEVDRLASVRWKNAMILAGYDLPIQVFSADDVLNLTLYWQTEQILYQELTVFVQLIDGADRIMLEQYHIPNRGLRPTTSWFPSEVVVDPYIFLITADIPPGIYRIKVGLVDPRTGERVTLSGGGDSWVLPLGVVVE